MVIRLVTNFFVPTLSKSIVVRSTSDSATIPNPYWSCLMHCPSERTCTTASLFTTGHFGTIPESSESVKSHTRGRTDPRLLKLDAGHVLRLQALGTLADFKFNSLPFVQSLVSVDDDGRKMDEHI